jgi:Toastrack DUF4097
MTMPSNLLRKLAPVAFTFLIAAPALADFRLERELALEPGGRLELDTDSGEVRVRGTNRSGVSVRITSPRSAAEIEEQFDLQFDASEGRVLVRVKRRDHSWFNSDRSNLMFEIEVPNRADLDIETSGGAINVARVEGRVDLATSGGRVDLEGIKGEIDAHTSGGGMEAIGIDGRARLRTSGGRVEVQGITGDLFAGSSGGSIEVRDAGGVVEASTSGGPISVSLARGNGSGGSLSTSGGGVTVYIDPQVSVDVDASTSGGSVTLEIPVTVRGRLSRSSVSGMLNGGGPTLRMRSSGGSIRLRSL